MKTMARWAGAALVLLLGAVRPAGAGTEGVFIDGESNVRDGPGGRGQVLFQPVKGTRVKVLEERGPWLRVQFEDGQSAWTHRQNLRLAAAVPGPTTTAEQSGHRMRARVDLNGDGAAEEVLLVPHRADPQTGGEVFRLAVRAGAGAKARTIWEDRSLATPFTISDVGVEDLELVGDIDGDGAVEIVSPEGQSDVSPTTFRILRWNGSGFERVKTGLLVGPANPREFKWTERAPAPERPASWILSFRRLEAPGLLRVTVASQGPDAQDVRDARVRVTPAGYRVEAWLPASP